MQRDNGNNNQKQITSNVHTFQIPFRGIVITVLIFLVLGFTYACTKKVYTWGTEVKNSVSGALERVNTPMGPLSYEVTELPTGTLESTQESNGYSTLQEAQSNCTGEEKAISNSRGGFSCNIGPNWEETHSDSLEDKND